MRAIDTNVIVRLFARDNPDQLKTARTLLEAPFLILPTVLMETIWVLRTSYKLPQAEIATKLTELIGLENAAVVSREAIEFALMHFGKGADFADALHVALAAEAVGTNFATFDRAIGNEIAPAPIPIETLT